MLDARKIAAALGGKIAGRDRVSAPGPGHSREDCSLSIKLDNRAPDGFLVFSHAGDDWRDCRDYVRQRLGLPDWQPGDEQDRRIPSARVAAWDRSAINAEAKEPPRQWTPDEIKRINNARRIWHDGKDARGTLAERYLTRHRRLEIPPGDLVRFHPACPWRDEDSGRTIAVPALIAPFRNFDDDRVTAIQRVRLNADGSKHDRRMFGVVERAAVKLDAAGNGELAVGEGVETCLAARQLGLHPAWALGSVAAIAALPVLDSVGVLTLLGEAGPASAHAVALCGERWRQAGRRVRVVMPDDGFSDLNDELMARAAP